MPRGDRTGPRGMGAMTGRAAGFCAGFGMPGYANPNSGRGAGTGLGRGGFWSRGFGGGRGRRNCFGGMGGPGFGSTAAAYPKSDPETEKQALQSRAEMLQTEMDHIKKRLAEIEDKV